MTLVLTPSTTPSGGIRCAHAAQQVASHKLQLELLL
jgi:hypothetical protein